MAPDVIVSGVDYDFITVNLRHTMCQQAELMKLLVGKFDSKLHWTVWLRENM